MTDTNNIIDLHPDSEKDDEVSIEMIQRGIKGGLGILEKQIDVWHENELNTEVSDVALAALKGIKNTLNNLDQLTDLIQNDTIQVIQRLEEQGISQWKSQAHLQTLLITLKKNNVITEEQLEQTWNDLMPAKSNSQ